MKIFLTKLFLIAALASNNSLLASAQTPGMIGSISFGPGGGQAPTASPTASPTMSPTASPTMSLGSDCIDSDDCNDGLTCDSNICRAYLGGQCSENVHCQLGYCTDEGVCGLKPHGYDCTSDEQCASGSCADWNNKCGCNTALQITQSNIINSGLSFLDSFESKLSGCRDNVESINEVVGLLGNVAKAGAVATQVGKSVGTALDRITAVVDLFGPVIYNVPKVGPVINKVVKALEMLEFPMEKIGDIHDILDSIETVLENAGRVLTGSEVLLQYEETLAGTAHVALLGAGLQSYVDECCAHAPISAYAEQFASQTGIWQDAYSAVETCDDLNFDLDLEFPDFEMIEKLLETIKYYAEEIEDFINDVYDKFMTEVDIYTCCNDGINFIAQFFEIPANMMDLATCWVDAGIEGIQAETLDALLGELEPLVNLYNDDFVAVVNSGFIDPLNDLVGAFSATLDLPSISLDVSSCTVEIETTTAEQDILDIDLSVSIPHFKEIDLDSDGSFDWDAIGSSIQSDCNDAWNAMTESDLDDCCCAAREAVGIDCEGKDLGESCTVGRGECASNHCGLSSNICVNACFISDDDCDDDQYCDRDRAVCEPLLEDGESCGWQRHGSCQSGYCRDASGTCTPTCSSDSDCPSDQFCGYDGTPNYKYCKNQKGRYGTCDRDRQCQSGDCNGWSLCTKP